MGTSLRFATAIEVMALLAKYETLTSVEIAEMLHRHEVIIRRVLNVLKLAGLLIVMKGRSGGCTLAKPTEEITLAEVWSATMGKRWVVEMMAKPPSPRGGAKLLNQQLAGLIDMATKSAMRSLDSVTVADVLTN
jgi:DNA-binding IscR family transcriptional regulator